MQLGDLRALRPGPVPGGGRQLLRTAYGCASCGILEWEHGWIVGFRWEERETATPLWEGPHLDHDFVERTEIDGAGLCGECYAAMLAINE